MIRIKSSLLSDEIQILDSSVYQTIVIENPKVFLQTCLFLHNDFKGETKFFEFFDQLSDEIEPATFLETPFSLNLNTKPNLNMLYKKLKSIYFDKIDHDLDGIKEKIREAVEDIKLDYDVPLTCNDSLLTEDLFKMMEVRFEEPEDIGVEQLAAYILTMHDMLKKSVIFTMNLRDYFDDKEIASLYQELSYRHVSIVDITAKNNVQKLSFESRIIIDFDLCEIK